LPFSLTVISSPICVGVPLLTSCSITSARALKWTLAGRRSAFARLPMTPFHTVMPSTVICGSSLLTRSCWRWHSRVTSPSVAMAGAPLSWRMLTHTTLPGRR
jgi:hypothetical protein